jgi:hypothetical protein
VDFHVAAGAGIGGNRTPDGSEEVGGTFDDVGFSADAGPMNDRVLGLRGGGLIVRSREAGLRICRVGSGDIFLPIIGAIAIGIGAGLGEQVINAAEIAQAPGIRDAIVEIRGRAVGQGDQARGGRARE